MASFRVCSSCRNDIDFGATYWVCSVSTCTRKRTGLFFCSVACWEVHLPSARHREAWAVEKRAPSQARYLEEQREERRKTQAEEAKPNAPAIARRRKGAESGDDQLPRDILIVVSKLKKYIKARSGMSTSDSVMPALSDWVRQLCDRAIRNAGEDGRKTVMDRDIPPL